MKKKLWSTVSCLKLECGQERITNKKRKMHREQQITLLYALNTKQYHHRGRKNDIVQIGTKDNLNK